MFENSLKAYLIEIGQYPLLTAEEELELGKRIADGDASARETLINCNLRLVVSIAKKYKNKHLTLQDLISEGNFGLMTAVEKYDYKLGYRFSTCATPWIKQAITKALTDKSKTVRIPAHIYALISKYKQAVNSLIAKDITHPTYADIAKEMDIDEEKVMQIVTWQQDTVSLETPLGDESDDTLGDLQADTHDESPREYTDRILLEEHIQKIISTFPTRTQTIMKMRYGLGTDTDPEEFRIEHTLEEIGDYLGITRERVRQIEKETLATMKNNWTRY